MTKGFTKEQLRIIELEKQVKKLEEVNALLSIDKSYGILTRSALEIEAGLVKGRVKFLAFLDIDYLHDFNERFGHEEANRRIRRALHLRRNDLVLSGKYYSGDEVAILLEGRPAEFCERLKEDFIREGLSITIAFVEYSGNLVKDATQAKAIVDRAKAARGSKR